MIPSIRVFGMVLRSAGWESNFQRRVETDSTVASKIASSAKVSRLGFSRALETARNTFRHANERRRLCSKPMPERRVASDLGDNEVSFIAEADTFFIHPGRRNSTRWNPRKVSTSPTVVDCPLRAGGFAQRTLLSGFQWHLLFNTLGNLEADARRRASVHRLPKQPDAAHHRHEPPPDLLGRSGSLRSG